MVKPVSQRTPCFMSCDCDLLDRLLRSFICCLLIFFSATVNAQQVNSEDSIRNLFLNQLSLFPQEKIYVHTDKDKFYAGETIWLRAYLVDAVFLKQANASRYVYIELINPLDEVVERIKLRPDSVGSFYGYISTGKELGTGNYSLRAYTRFMQNIGQEYFFTKSIRVINPVSEMIKTDINYSESAKNITAEIIFRTNNDSVLKPESCTLYHKNIIEVSEKGILFNRDKGVFSLSQKDMNKSRIFLLKAQMAGKEFSAYFRIPFIEKSFDVAFFPEGGHAPLATQTTIAFKALNTDGLGEEIKGKVYDDENQLCTEFSTTHLGMGVFNLYYSPGRKYYAICTNNSDVTRRFDLPTPTDGIVTLKTVWENNNLFVTLVRSENYTNSQPLTLIAHVRGVPLYVKEWNMRQDYLSFEKNFFPAGIIHFLLVDADRNILSERLVFSTNAGTLARANINLNKEFFQTREKLNLSLNIRDENNEPLPGFYSISVVDTKFTDTDSSRTVISELLLSSEVKGYIEEPMSYFRNENKKTIAALDVLMMTQGWRRYDVVSLLKGKPTNFLSYPVELSEEVSGVAEGLLTNHLKDGHITLIALRDSIIGTAYTQPDKKGRFVFKDLEYPEGTKYIIQANTRKGAKTAFLTTDSAKSFPQILPQFVVERKQPKADSLSANELSRLNTKKDGMKMLHLSELTVIAKRRKIIQTDSPYYSVNSSMVITSKEIENWRLLSVYDLLRRIPGVTVTGSEVRYRGNTPMLLLDNIPVEGFDYNMLQVDDIKDAFVTSGTSMGAIFGSRGGNGAIVINTKKGFVQTKSMSNNIRYVNADGYQQSVQFYAPVYDTYIARNSSSNDFRSTIYWNPKVEADTNGRADVSFYSADIPTKYRIVVEGISIYGHLLYKTTDTFVTER